MAHFCERKFFAAKPCFLAAVVVILYGNISDIVQILYALVAQPVEHLTFNQRARDSSSLERTKIPRGIVRFLVGFFCSPTARSLHGFHITAEDHQLVGGAGMPQTMEHDAGELRVRM